MECEIGVEGDQCNGSDGLGGKKGSSPRFMIFFHKAGSKQATTSFTTRCLQHVLVHLQDPLFSYKNRPKAYGVIWKVVWSLGKVRNRRNKARDWFQLTQVLNQSFMIVGFAQ